MIHVLCMSCHTHLADTDVTQLDWPLFGEYFSVVFPGWYLRPGMLNLDVYCPACGAFPFGYNPHESGGNAVGKNLCIEGPRSRADRSGKPMVLTVKQILLGSREPAPLSQGEPPTLKTIHGETPQGKMPGPRKEVSPGGKPAEFPCSACGAKKRFHKKGCVLKAENPFSFVPPEQIKAATKFDGGTEPIEPPISFDKHARLSEKKDRQRATDPLIASIAGRIGAKRGDTGAGPPTPEEVAEVMADREARRIGR